MVEERAFNLLRLLLYLRLSYGGVYFLRMASFYLRKLVDENSYIQRIFTFSRQGVDCIC